MMSMVLRDVRDHTMRTVRFVRSLLNCVNPPAVLLVMLVMSGMTVMAGATFVGQDAPASEQASTETATQTSPEPSPQSSPQSSTQSSTDAAGVPAPIPSEGVVPPIPGAGSVGSERELTMRARVREYEKQLRIIKRKYFGAAGMQRAEALRAEGFAQLREFTDPAAFGPMLKLFGDAEDEIVLMMLDHFATLEDDGQAVLASVAIFHERPAIRNEATVRITMPPVSTVLGVLDGALRSQDSQVVSNAALLAGTHNILETIPLLIFGQAAATGREEGRGDIAWIAIETQRAYVQGVNPVAGNAAGAFAPIIGTVSEGSVLRIQDAVVITYRTVVHRVLVSMTTADWGESTAELGYDLNGWWSWYNGEYVPFKANQAALKALAEEPAAGSAPTQTGVDGPGQPE